MNSTKTNSAKVTAERRAQRGGRCLMDPTPDGSSYSQLGLSAAGRRVLIPALGSERRATHAEHGAGDRRIVPHVRPPAILKRPAVCASRVSVPQRVPLVYGNRVLLICGPGGSERLLLLGLPRADWFSLSNSRLASVANRPPGRQGVGASGSVTCCESSVTYGRLPAAPTGCGETGRFFLMLACRSAAPSGAAWPHPSVLIIGF